MNRLLKSGLTTIFTLWSILSIAAEPASTNEKTESGRQAAFLAPFIDDQTVLVIALRWPEAQVAQSIELLNAVRPDTVEVSEARAALAALTASGVREAYLVGGLAYFPERSPLVVVPIAGMARVGELLDILKKQCEAAVVWQDAVIAGDAETVARAQRDEARVRPEVGDAFQAVESATMQLLFLPTSEQRAVLEAMLPRLPAECGGASTKTLTRGCQWAALGFHISPKTSLKLVVKAADPPSAVAFHALWERLVEVACRHPDVVAAMPRLVEPSRVLTPLLQTDRSLLELDAANQGIAALSALLRAPAAMARSSANHAESRQKLRIIGLALQNYADKHGGFPPISNSSWGVPLLSWRVHLLPLLGEEELYSRFHLNEQWNSKHNRQLIELMPTIYRRAGQRAGGGGRTPYVTPRGKGTALDARGPTPYEAFRDTTSKTIMVVEAAAEHEVVWTRPKDLDYDADQPLRGLDEAGTLGFHALFADGHVRLIHRDTDREVLRALFSRAGGEDADFGE
jgi:prepilin-type processing-associated H-X9-DG protein